MESKLKGRAASSSSTPAMPPTPADSNPRITWGKYMTEHGRTTMPVTLLANHALVGGVHIGAFYDRLREELDRFVEGRP